MHASADEGVGVGATSRSFDPRCMHRDVACLRPASEPPVPQQPQPAHARLHLGPPSCREPARRFFGIHHWQSTSLWVEEQIGGDLGSSKLKIHALNDFKKACPILILLGSASRFMDATYQLPFRVLFHACEAAFF